MGYRPNPAGQNPAGQNPAGQNPVKIGQNPAKVPFSVNHFMHKLNLIKKKYIYHIIIMCCE